MAAVVRVRLAIGTGTETVIKKKSLFDRTFGLDSANKESACDSRTTAFSN